MNVTGGRSFYSGEFIADGIWNNFLAKTKPTDPSIAFKANMFEKSLNLKVIYLRLEAWKSTTPHNNGTPLVLLTTHPYHPHSR